MIALALAPCACLAALVYRYGVNIPHWDQWMVSWMFDLSHHDGVTFDYLISQHNESRKVFPRLLILGLAKLTHWNTRYEMGVIVLLAAIVSLNVWTLARRTIGGAFERRAVLWLLANLIIFSPVQAENWLWGIQIVVFVPIVCISTALVIFTTRLPIVLKAIIAAILGMVATFSYANGLLTFVVLLPTLLALGWIGQTSPDGGERRRTSWLGLGTTALLVGAMFVACVWVYFIKYPYQRPAGSPPMSDALKAPTDTIRYFFAFLGSPLKGVPEFEKINQSVTIGAILFALWLAVVGRLIAVRDANLIRRCLPWLAITSYTLASAVLTSAGRVGLGVEQSLSSRYTTFSNYLIVPLIYLVTIHIDDWLTRRPRSSGATWGAYVLGSMCGVAMLTGYIPSAACGYREIRLRTHARLTGKACVQFVKLIEEPHGLNNLYPQPSDVIQIMCTKLNRWGYLTPKLIRSPDLSPLVATTTHQTGYFEVIGFDPVDGYFVQGWGRMPTRRDIADLVVLTYDDPQTQHPMLVGLAAIHVKRRDISATLGDSRYLMSGWYTYLKPDKIPVGAHAVTAWVFDAELQRMYKIGEKPIPGR